MLSLLLAAGLPLFVPPAATKEAPAPLLVVCHGQGGTAAGELETYRAFAEAEGWAVLALQGTVPDGKGFTWEGSPETARKAADDVRQALADRPAIHPGRIVWVGMSAGCWACCELGAPLAGDLCHGIVLMAAPTALLAAPPEGRAPPRTLVFLGTEDFNFHGYERRLQELKGRGGVFSLNTVEGLGHAFPRPDYLRSALRWVLEGDGSSEENRLPHAPPRAEDLKCRHLLVRSGSGGRAPDEARARAEGFLQRLKAADGKGRRALVKDLSEDAATRRQGGALDGKTLDGEGDLLRWTCWTLKPGDVRLVRGRSGFHLVWSDR